MSLDLGKALHAAGFDSDEKVGVPYWLSTGVASLDYIVSGQYQGGGLPVGRMVEISGPESSGKTVVATNVMIAAQQAGGFAMFMDHERSFDTDLAETNGLSVDPSQWLYKTPKTLEESVDTAAKVASTIRRAGLPMDKPIVMVFDSLAAMIPQSTLGKDHEGKDMAEMNMNDTTALARATSTSFKYLAAWAFDNNVVIVVLNQIREKPGVTHGSNITTPGGNAMKFYASVRLQLSRSMEKDGKEIVGQMIKVKSIKNKVHRPFLETDFLFTFQEDGTGAIDVAANLVDEAVRRGAIELKGARVTWTDGRSFYKSQLGKVLTDEGKLDELRNLLYALDTPAASAA